MAQDCFPEEIQEIVERMKEVKGILMIKPLIDEERTLILKEEEKAEERMILGSYKPFNASLREALSRAFTLAIAVKSTEFPFNYHPIVKLLQGSIILGEEIEDPKGVARLRAEGRNIFLWNHFVIYPTRISAMRARMKMEEKAEETAEHPRLVYIPRPLQGLPLPPQVRRVVVGCPSLEGHRLLLKILKIEIHGGEASDIGTLLLGFDLEKETFSHKT